MTLKEWLAARDSRGTRAKLVRDAETSFSTVAKALRGEPLDRKSALRISAATAGEVTLGAPYPNPPVDKKSFSPNRMFGVAAKALP